MILTLIVLASSCLLGAYLYNNRRVPASCGDWLIVKSKMADGSFFMLTFYPIIGWKVKNSEFVPEIQNTKQLKRFEDANKELDSIFYTRGNRVFNPYANNHPVGSLDWFVSWVCSEDTERVERCWENEVPSSLSELRRTYD